MAWTFRCDEFTHCGMANDQLTSMPLPGFTEEDYQHYHLDEDLTMEHNIFNPLSGISHSATSTDSRFHDPLVVESPTTNPLDLYIGHDAVCDDGLRLYSMPQEDLSQLRNSIPNIFNGGSRRDSSSKKGRIQRNVGYESRLKIVKNSSSRHHGASHTGPFNCQWKGCSYDGVFSRKSVLLRHIQAMHLSPGAYPCPDPDCLKSFNRKDNLTAHIRNVHWKQESF